MEPFDPKTIRFMVIETDIAGALANLQALAQVTAQLRSMRDHMMAQGVNLPPDSFRLLQLLEVEAAARDSQTPSPS